MATDERSAAIAQTDLYTRTTGYNDKKLYSWEGRGATGFSLGIIELTVNIAFHPGDINNASTFDFPVRFESLGEVDPHWVVSSEPHPEIIKRSIAAAKRLELKGVRAVMGNCGFFGNYQEVVAAELNVPFFGSSLLQTQMVLATVRPDQKVGILTANGEQLKAAPALEQCGVSDMDRIVIYGLENEPEMSASVLGVSGNLNPAKLERDLLKVGAQMVQDHPEIGAIILECSEFPPHAFKLQELTKRPMWGFTTLAYWIHAGLIRHPYSGWM